MANTVNTDKNVSRETNIQGATNNVGQEIQKQAPSTVEVVKCTMTEEEHLARMQRIHDRQEQGLRLSWDIMVDITSAWSRNEQVLDGYSETSEDFLKWAFINFGIKDTQVKQARRVVEFYGSIDDKGEYSLEDKYKRYTKEKLDIIQRLPAMSTKAKFDDTVESLGIMPSTSEDTLKSLVRQAKGLPEPQPKAKVEKKTTANNTESGTPDESVIKSTPVYKVEVDKGALMRNFIAEHIAEANKVVESKKDKLAMAFVVKFLEDFKAMESSYNEIGRKNDDTENSDNSSEQ